MRATHMSSVVSIATAADIFIHIFFTRMFSLMYGQSNADSAQSIVALIEAASANLEQVTKSALAEGVGTSVDISA